MICRSVLFRASSLTLAVLLMAVLASPLGAADRSKAKAAPSAAAAKLPAVKPANEAAIRDTAKAFVATFNRGDAAALAAMFTASASVADDEGEVLRGQTAIRDKYAELFKAYPGAKISIAVKSVEFPMPEMAIEDGLSQVAAEHAGPPVISRYTACHILTGGKWLMASVREAKVPITSNHSRVESLGWLVGTWKAERDGTTVESKIGWFANKSFLERQYKTCVDGVVVSGGKQIVGWDPTAGKIRSWSFDASGGYGTGVWTDTPEGWQIESSGVLADGTPTASRDFLIRVPGEDNVLGWRSTARTMGEVSLPNTPEVVLDRVAEKK